MMQTWLYRHDDIVTYRPYGIDVDEADWLWEGCGYNRLSGHNLRAAETVQIPVPAMGNRPVYQAFAWHGKLVLTLGEGPFYLVFDPVSRKAVRKQVPAQRAIVWYGTKTPNAKVILYERSESKALVLDGPDAEPRAISCPYPGQLASGSPQSDGLVYSVLTDPARIARFDPVSEHFVDEIAIPFPDTALSGRHEHEGVLYFCDSARGRLLPLELATRRWLDPIPAPDYRKVYGFMGGTFSFKGKAHICLSTYAHASRLDPKTGKIILPEGPLSIDGKPHRFLDRYLVFDPENRSFDYLVAPEQPDGVPLLCYNWTDGKRFAITGIVIPYAKPGELGNHVGPWLVLQSEEAADVPGFDCHDVNFDRQAHLAGYRRSYPAHHSLYLPERTWSPAIKNMEGPATDYSPGKEAEILRRVARTDPNAYWKELAGTVTRGCSTDAERVRRVGGFIHNAVFYNAIQEPVTNDPIASLECRDIRCGKGVAITLRLLEALGIPARSVGLSHHVVAEATYDGSDHIVDALFFGSYQPKREGRVLSVAELKAAPYFADGWAQECFAYDPELVLSVDGFNVQGYVFGPWGAEPYYSFYLGAPKDCPPTFPTVLPAERLGGDRVRLHWSKSLKRGGGEIEYEVRVFNDRACKDKLFEAMRAETWADFDVPEGNRMYFVTVRAMDDHRQKNPNTWYPACRGNFVLVPNDQYGWYGVL
jgi:hypothetical protein